MATPDVFSTPPFGHARRGYDRAAVDAHVAETAHRIAELTEEVTRLRSAVSAAEVQRVTLSERAGEVLRTADSRAAETRERAARGELPAAEAYAQTRTECEQLLTAAQIEAARVLASAQQQAATVTERARQEFAWGRRRVREEQDLVDLRKQQIVRQIATLSALATGVAVGADGPNMPAVSEQPVAAVAG